MTSSTGTNARTELAEALRACVARGEQALVLRNRRGWVAWGIGGLVGFGTLLLGGRGSGMGIAAAGRTRASIFASSCSVVVVEGSSTARESMPTRRQALSYNFV